MNTFGELKPDDNPGVSLLRATGVVSSIKANFGFIKQDSGEADMFALAPLPPVGHRVSYDIVEDAKTGRPRAENLQAEGNGDAGMSNGSPVSSDYLESVGLLASAGRCTGVVREIKNNFGFIQQDSGEPDMFLLPPFPPVGSRVAFDIKSDAKTGRPRAENVEVLGGSNQHQPPAWQAASQFNGPPAHHQAQVAPRNVQPPPTPAKNFLTGNRRLSGMMSSLRGNFGFIAQDSGETDMFVLPPFPPLGTRVTYEVVIDEKTGRPRAQEVRPEEWDRPQQPSYVNPHAKGKPSGGKEYGGKGQMPQQSSYGSPGQRTGTVFAVKGNFGFIAQDNGEPDMFTLPPFPDIGTRVTYSVVVDGKTGRPRAENVNPLHEGAAMQHTSYGGGAGQHSVPGRSQPYNASAPTVATGEERGEMVESGIVVKRSTSFGFVERDSGGPHMFIIPQACAGFGNELPPEGTRISYRVVIDGKTGRPRAEDVYPATV